MKRNQPWGRAGGSVSFKRNGRCKGTEVGMTLAQLGSKEKADEAEQTGVLTDEVGEVWGGLIGQSRNLEC